MLTIAAHRAKTILQRGWHARQMQTSASVTNVSYGSNTKQLYVGERCSNAIVDYLAKNNLSKVLLITSKTLDTTTNEVKMIETALDNCNKLKHKITGIREHNPDTDALHSIEMARKYDVDCVCVVGGGSVIDNGKIAALLKNEPLNKLDSIDKLDEYSKQTSTYGVAPLDESNELSNVPHIIMVPTTLCGTSHIAGYKSTAVNTKLGLRHSQMVPQCMIFDPIVTQYTPQWIWDSTAVRCIDHCAEIIGSRLCNTYWHWMAVNTLNTVLKNLPLTANTAKTRNIINYNSNNYNSVDCVDDELSSVEYNARLELLMANFNALVPFMQGAWMGVSHSISYGLGGVCGVPHGYTSCVLLWPVLKWNLLNCDRMDYDDAQYIRTKQEVIKQSFLNVLSNYNNMSEYYSKFDRIGEMDECSDMVKEFVTQMGLPTTLAQVNADDVTKFDAIAERAMMYPYTAVHPVKIKGVQDIIDILNIASANESKQGIENV